MKKIQITLLGFLLPILCLSQVSEIKFNTQSIDFSLPPRTNISPMSIKLMDNYNKVGAPTTYGSILEIYGLAGHQTSQLYFGGWDNSKIRYREAFYNQNTWSSWITLLDSKNIVESDGVLKIKGTGNSSILGNLGIGTATPTAKLDVNGNIAVGGLGAGSDASPLSKKIAAYNYQAIEAGAIDFLDFNTNRHASSIAFRAKNASNVPEEFMRIVGQNGFVGIGTITPTEKLHVNGTILATSFKKSGALPGQFLMADGTTTTATASQNFTSFKSSGTYDQYVPVVFQTINAIDNGNKPINISRPYIHQDRDWLAHGLATITAIGFGWGSEGNSIRLDNFTYGRTNADHSGEVISFVGRTVVDWGGNNVIVFLRGGTTYYTDGKIMKNDGTFVDVAGQQNFTSVSILDPLYNIPKGTYYSDFDITKKTSVFSALASGNVGIGTTAPDEKLAINGNIHAKEVRVDLTGWPDYVFQKYYTGKSELKSDYELPTLAQIEDFTKQNHHLPNVPSAATILEKGLQLGEMSNTLLQKVEELTIYAIEQQKEIELLKTQVKTLLEAKR